MTATLTGSSPSIQDDPVEKVLAALRSREKAPRPSGTGWTARCPAHDDLTPSLTIGVRKDGEALVYCQAGCETEDVVTALGLKMRDLFRGPSCRVASPRAVEYGYQSAEQKLLFQVVRGADKRFYQRRPDGQGGWINSTSGVRKVLYRLPEVIAAVAVGNEIWIVEGEKDAERLAYEGLVATCNPGGAGRWRPEYNEVLRGARVVVISDNDEPGRKHAEQVLHSLNGVTSELRRLDLPVVEHGDVTDYLGDHSLTDLLELKSSTEPWAPSANRSPDVPPTASRPNDKWAKMPAEVICSELDDQCTRLYAYLDLVQGDRGRPAVGYAKTGKKLGWQDRTVEKHADHLEECGLIKKSRVGNGGVEMRVLHNRSRGRNAGVDLPAPRERYRKTSDAKSRFQEQPPTVPRPTRVQDNGTVPRPPRGDEQVVPALDAGPDPRQTQVEAIKSPAPDAGLSRSYLGLNEVLGEGGLHGESGIWHSENEDSPPFADKDIDRWDSAEEDYTEAGL